MEDREGEGEWGRWVEELEGKGEGVGKRVEGNGRGGGKMAVRRPITQYSREEEVYI